MPITIDGTNGITQAGEFNSDSSFGFKNRIINGGFTINQRGYVTNTSLTSGSYGHDRWKGGASNGTYTFTQASAGVNTTITITAGSIIQVIEGANLPEGGTYVLSWTGTAQGKIGAGSFGASGITGTITAGTNTNIEFNTGTCGNVQLEVGSTATSFDYRSYGTELALCQRYYQQYNSTGDNAAFMAIGYCDTSSRAFCTFQFPVYMRTAPSLTVVSATSFALYNVPADTVAASSISLAGGSSNGIVSAATVIVNSSGVFTAGRGTVLKDAGSNANGRLQFSAEL